MPGASFRAIEEALAETDNIRRVSWTPEELREKYLQRSVRQMAQEGTTHYANPCGDLTFYLKYALQERDVGSALYVEVVRNGLWGRGGVLGVHFGLALDDGRYLHICKLNQAVLGEGELPPDGREEVRRLQLLRLPGQVDPDKSLLEHYPDVAARLPVALDQEIEHLIKDNDDPYEYTRYLRRLDGHQHLYLLKEEPAAPRDHPNL